MTLISTHIDNYTKYWFRNPSRQVDINKSNHTFSSGYQRFLKRLQKVALEKKKTKIDGDLILDTVLTYPAKTDSRKRAVTCLSDLAQFLKVDLPEHFRSYGNGYTTSSVEDRDLPSDDLIIQTYKSIPDQKVRNAFALQATYGLRNHEVFLLHWDYFHKSGAVRTDKSTKTGERLAFPIPKDWIQMFNIHPDMELPSLIVSDSYKEKGRDLPSVRNYGYIPTYWFREYNIPFNPYDLRHSFALRTIEKGLQPAIAAQLMGHSLQVHSSVYHRHIQLSQLEQALSSI